MKIFARVLEAGAFGYLKKPFHDGALCSYSPREKIVEGTAFKDIDTGQTLRHFLYKSDDYRN